MRAVIQRVKNARVEVENKTVGSIGQGFLILLGVMNGDAEEQADILAGKVARLRVFEDENQKMNLSLADIGGEALVVSQFTLCADVKKGNRPSFTPSAEPKEANRLYEYFMLRLAAEGIKKPEHGIFGADMQVSLTNDGPVTIIFDTDIWTKQK
ncbi:MAG: D-tyrosyl-tRNA(Tyr) deacylase [Oscillospiraceae bacterium]|nr:D-tyrosyl-tRNA(Tyr) deacylase [Oscillospiraceae bacterium]